ncbi:TonB-dependent receptor [Pseudoxanthomonas broegbernensis]|nr:TonB-dependent receptor [Pseudoxanthomonas broegbernensis]MBB6065165.1 outer membrane receptor protein involved in Fe transport [Pseudoxanthomonas broegbernensis]
MSATTPRLGLLAAACMLAISGMPAAAQAQQQEVSPGAEQPTQLETVAVTGSRIRRVDAETANPVFTMDRQTIEKSGYMTVGELLQQLPNIAGAGMTTADNSYGGTGASTVSLRGLGSERTLILLNGVRYYAGDVNALPANMIQRIEVLKDGASVVYGSDAIAGVVNVITRQDVDGVEVSAYYGASDKGDAQTQSYQLTFGKTFDRGTFVGGLNYGKQKAMWRTDRDWSEVSQSLSYGKPVFAGSSTIPNGRFAVPRAAAAALDPSLDCGNAGNTASTVYLTRRDGAAGASAADFRCYIASGEGNDTYEYAGETQLSTPQDRYSLFLNGSYDLSPSVTFFADGFYTHTRSDSTLASDPLLAGNYGVVASGAGIYNPFGTDISNFSIRLVDLGPRVRTYDRDDVQVTTGLRGRLGRFDWDTAFTYAKQQQRITKTGSIYLPALQNAIGTSFLDADGVARCGAPGAAIANCTPLNVFGPLTREQLQAFSPTLINLYDGEQTDFLANITGDLFDLPAGPVGAAFGYEYRRQKSDFQPDYLLANKMVDATPEAPSRGSYDVNEVYAEFSAPLLADKPFAQALNLTAGVRYSDYSSFGDTTNSKLGLEWRPYADLLVRASYADIFRAPTIDDLYGGQTGDTPTVNDPCSGAAAGVGACSGVPAGFIGEKQPPATNGSNPSLQPETGRATNVGFVYNPSFYTPLTVSLDFWQYRIEDAIVAPGAQTILDLCYRAGLPSYCSLVTRGAQGNIVNIDNTLANVGAIETRGVDLGLHWTLGQTRFGHFQLSFDGTYLDSYDYTAVSDQPGTRVGYAGKWKGSDSGGLGNFARNRARTTLNWSQGDFSAALVHRYVSHVYVDNLDTASGAHCDGSRSVVDTPQGGVVCKYKVPAYNYVDLSGAWHYAPWNATFSLGVNNLFDKEMDSFAVDYSTYDVIGRFVYARMSFAFE